MLLIQRWAWRFGVAGMYIRGGRLGADPNGVKLSNFGAAKIKTSGVTLGADLKDTVSPSDPNAAKVSDFGVANI